MKFNLETIKEYLTNNENEWCADEDWWGDVERVDAEDGRSPNRLISINVYSTDGPDDWDDNCDRYGVTIYELEDDDRGFWEDETDECIVGQLYFNHIKSHTEGKLFRLTDVIDYSKCTKCGLSAPRSEMIKSDFQDFHKTLWLCRDCKETK